MKEKTLEYSVIQILIGNAENYFIPKFSIVNKERGHSILERTNFINIRTAAKKLQIPVEKYFDEFRLIKYDVHQEGENYILSLTLGIMYERPNIGGDYEFSEFKVIMNIQAKNISLVNTILQ